MSPGPVWASIRAASNVADGAGASRSNAGSEYPASARAVATRLVMLSTMLAHGRQPRPRKVDSTMTRS